MEYTEQLDTEQGAGDAAGTGMNRRSKLCSAKLWVTIWAMFMVTFIIMADRSNYTNVLPMLAGVPIAYIGANVMQKKIYSDRQ